MLNHKDNTEAAPMAHITPEELAAAVTAIEKRRQTESGERQPISQLLNEMGLDITEAELLAEVQTRRVRPKARRAWRLPKRNVLVAGTLAVAGLFFTLAGTWLLTPNDTDGVNSQFFGETNASLATKLLVQEHSGSSPVIRTLAETPEGHTVFCSAEAAEYAATSRQYRFEPHPVTQDAQNMTWPVVKYHSELYLRGWTPAVFSQAAAKQAERIAVYNAPTAPGAGARPTQITVRLMPNMFANGIGYWHEPGTAPEIFYCARLNLDKHAYEKWKP